MADVYGKPVVLLQCADQECLGAAILAGAGVGVYEDAVKASRSLMKTIHLIEPNPSLADTYNRLFEVYKSLYGSLRGGFKKVKEM